MNDFLYSINAVVPLFVFVIIGYYIKKAGKLDAAFVDIFSKFAFTFAIPIALFNTAYRSNISENLNPKLALYNTLGILIVVIISWIIVPRLTTSVRAGSIVQGIYRANLAIFGLPLATNMFGAEHLAPTAIMIAISVPVYNSISVVQLSLMGEHGKERPSVLSVLISVCQNPLLIATLLGVVFSYFSITVPQVLATPLDNFAACATPIALIALGGQFSFNNAKFNFKASAIVTLVRLVLVPLFLMPIFILAGFRGGELGALLINFCTPIATSTFVMAAHFGCDAHLAGELVLFTTFFSAFTIFGWVFSLKYLGFI